MNSTALPISFDSNGVCSYCTEFEWTLAHRESLSSRDRDEELRSIVTAIKQQGRKKPYDCIVGVSGGVDSSWTLVQAVELGLRPLAVHMDNGWNSELAQNNISALVRKLNVDLYTEVVQWESYRSLMDAFLEADVIDIELLYDNAMLAVNYQQARKFGLRNIVAGTNLSTEGIRVPSTWNWYKYDARNIKSIGIARSRTRANGVPHIGVYGLVWSRVVRRIRWISLLDFVGYVKSEALDVLMTQFDFKPYPHKHYESVFTRLYMGEILPRKFGVDMRRVDYSSLILTGQMERDDALRDLEVSPYDSDRALESDTRYFLKKMGWSREQWLQYLARPGRPHQDFPSEIATYRRLKRLASKFRGQKSVLSSRDSAP